MDNVHLHSLLILFGGYERVFHVFQFLSYKEEDNTDSFQMRKTIIM